jgi:hypothetical protein
VSAYNPCIDFALKLDRDPAFTDPMQIDRTTASLTFHVVGSKRHVELAQAKGLAEDGLVELPFQPCGI